MSYARILFPELRKELERNPELIGNLNAFFTFKVFHKKKLMDTWFCLFQKGQVIIQNIPLLSVHELTPVIIEVEDRDLLKLITGGMTGYSAMAQNKLKILGDLHVAQEGAQVFVNAGGVQKVMSYIKQHSKL